MLRFMKGGYSRKELQTLEIIFKQLAMDFDYCETDCQECEYKHICEDISSMTKYLGELLWKK